MHIYIIPIIKQDFDFVNSWEGFLFFFAAENFIIIKIPSCEKIKLAFRGPKIILFIKK